MSGLSISFIDLLVKGIPEGFLFVFAVYIFTRIKFDVKKYLILSVLFTILTYVYRKLPIFFGVNTILSLLTLILLFIVFYRVNLQILIKTIVSVIAIAIIIIISEELNFLILNGIYGHEKTQSLFKTEYGVSIYSIPSTIMFAVIVFIVFFVLLYIDKHKKDNDGNAG